MFFDYACSYFYMAHDGVIEAYRQLGASAEEERIWRSEYIDYWVSRLSVEDLTAVNSLQHAHAGEALPALINIAGLGDSFAQLWIANVIWELAGMTGASPERTLQARQLATEIWQWLITEPLVLSRAHRTQILPSLESFGAASPEDYVRKYAARKLEDAQSTK